jgi:thioredoxin 1
MQELTSDNFVQKTNKGVCVIDFWAEWCKPCKMLKPILDDLAKDFKSVRFFGVDVEKQTFLTTHFEITGVPTIMFFVDGICAKKVVGLIAKIEVKKILDDITRKPKEISEASA